MAVPDQTACQTDLLAVPPIMLKSCQQLLHCRFLLMSRMKGQATEIEQMSQNSPHSKGFRHTFPVWSRPLLWNSHRFASFPAVPVLDRLPESSQVHVVSGPGDHLPHEVRVPAVLCCSPVASIETAGLDGSPRKHGSRQFLFRVWFRRHPLRVHGWRALGDAHGLPCMRRESRVPTQLFAHCALLESSRGHHPVYPSWVFPRKTRGSV